jgi:hypothetical protein
MPVILNVTGPHQIAWAAVGTVPTNKYLGRADNDDLFNIELEYQYTDVMTNELGNNPSNAILMGARAFAAFTLVTFDPTAVTELFQHFDGQTGTGSNTFYFPKVGSVVYDSATEANSLLVALKVIPDGAGGPAYLLPRCRLITSNVKDVGNKATRAGFRFEILPGAAGNPIYVRS